MLIGYVSPIWGEVSSNLIATKCGLWFPFPDVINCAKFNLYCTNGFWVAGPQKLDIPIDLRGDLLQQLAVHKFIIFTIFHIHKFECDKPTMAKCEWTKLWSSGSQTQWRCTWLQITDIYRSPHRALFCWLLQTGVRWVQLVPNVKRERESHWLLGV